MTRLYRRLRCWLGVHRAYHPGSDEGVIYICADCREIVAGRAFR